MASIIDELKGELSRAISAPSLDINQVIDITNRLALSDPNLVRFSTDAGIISRLGRELVAKQETAVAELIKNAYDADATTVDLIFEDALRPGGTLIIQDNGSGMNRDQLVKGFMRLSSSDKIENPVSNVFGRTRAGRKGIGRFAVQRLGKSLTILTQGAGSESCLGVEIDWSAFTAGKELIAVANKVQQLPKKPETGTTLIIKGLLEDWTDAEIRRSYRYILELIQPFALDFGIPVASKRKDINTISDPGFNVAISRLEKGKLTSIADETESIFKYSTAKIEAYVDESGIAIGTVSSDRFDLAGLDSLFEDTKFVHLKNLRLVAYYFIWQPDFYPRTVFSSLRAMSQERSGIRVYRNGFRVPPYGDINDDWLGLDASTANRDILPPHANVNFLGFVQISDREGATFEETSSREGLIENEAFRELRKFCADALKQAALRIAHTRGRKQTKSQRDWNAGDRNPSDVIRRAAENLIDEAEERQKIFSNTPVKRGDERSGADDERFKSSEDFDSFFKKATSLAEEILDAEGFIREEQETTLQELGMLRVLASLGLNIGEFTHEVRQTLGAAKLDADSLSKVFDSESPQRRKAIRLSTNINRFATYASYFDKAIRENISRELTPQDLRMEVNSFISIIEPRADSQNINLESRIAGYDLVTRPMHASEITSILFNLFSNAQKAIRRAGVVGSILIEVFSTSDTLNLLFHDNGDGIREENLPFIFDAFFSTSIDLNSADDGQSSGLGLKIVKDIVEGYKGTVSVASPKEGFSTCIKVELPANSN